MLPGTSGSLPQHSDVLLADTPASAEDAAKLIDELKRRGNHAFKNGSLAEAELLYGRAIEHDPKQAPLWGNRCAARVGMKKWTEALADADEAIKVQPDWAKGHFRRGQCLAGLGRWAEAQRAYERALELEPANADAKREAAKAQAHVSGTSTPSPASTPKPSSSPAAAKTPSTPPAAPSSAATATDEADGDSGEVFRGYKKLDDGRTTTFFHREIPAEEKAKLAAANAPKKVDAAPAPAPVDKGKSSAWNAAGTFEERDMTAWAKERITALVKGTSTIFEEAEGVVEVTGVSELEGSASVSFIRGQKRFPFDFTFAADWSTEVDDKTVTGKLFYREFTSESPDRDTEVRWPDRQGAGDKAAALLKHLKTQLKPAIDARLSEWVDELKQL